ncbi:hypothetical protein BST97_14105 [Nonlabens spongiae]|uniref:Uncharacterized protein n=1 Tax=Nonlabens spongiae TaxID=331648 RepID=A0A1W6MN62_9FLAO|nr:hypothetical protein [Nonlabens spongiae]ARN79030.1 hypothetical protein BST97_14105 [Nonlabens spongiae]
MNIKLLPYYLVLPLLFLSCSANQDVAQLQKSYEATSNELLSYKAQNMRLQQQLTQLEEELNKTEKVDAVVSQSQILEKPQEVKKKEAKAKS